MLEQQRELSDRFDDIAAKRSGPVYFIEHGLDEAETTELSIALRSAVTVHPPADPYWESHPLPLLIVATEVGYLYRGTGTDFWPLLEEKLGVPFPPQTRLRLRDLFRVAAERYRGASPPTSAWANAFHLIAWPITHALLPVEFHRPLAATLAQLHECVGNTDDMELYLAVRRAAGIVSARFETWLSDRELVVAIVRQLLGENRVGDLDQLAFERIIEDLSRDDIARRDVTLARRQQERPRVLHASKKSTPSTYNVKGQLQLQRHNGQITLEAWFPRLDEGVLETLRRALRLRRYAPSLWNVSARVPSEQFLSGLPFALKLSSLPEDGVSLFPGLDKLDISVEHRSLLQAFSIDIDIPLLFASDDNGEVARQVRGKNLSDAQTYWLLTLPEYSFEIGSQPVLCNIGPYACIEFDLGNPTAVEALQRLGYDVRHRILVRFAGAPPLERGNKVPRFEIDDLLFLASSTDHPIETLLRSEDNEIISPEKMIRIPVLEGEHSVRLLTPDGPREYRYCGIPKRSDPIPQTCWIELVSPENSVQALLAGQFSLRVDAIAPLEGLELIVGIVAGGQRVSVSLPLGPLPETVGQHSELWSSLLDEALRGTILHEEHIVLDAQIGTLASSVWLLEQRVTPCWWERNSPALTLCSELGPQAFGGVSAMRPLAPPIDGLKFDEEDAVLLLPMNLDAATFGTASQFSGLCIAPARMSLVGPEPEKIELKRVRQGMRGEAAGLEDLIKAYLQWSVAESTSLTAEMRRRQVTRLLDSWVSEICCGPEWASRESSLQNTDSDPWQILLKQCESTGLGRDPYVSLSPNDELTVTRLAVAEIRRGFPELWTRVGPPCDLHDSDYEALDLACGRAYGELASKYTQLGEQETATKIAEGDPGAVAENWDKVFASTKSRAEVHELAEMLLPTNSANHLMSLDYTLMSLDDLTEELVRWCSETQTALVGGAIDRGVIVTILQLWIEPARAVHGDWRGALDALLSDRCVARALRYASIRSREQRG